jgi:hypothetical protein
MGRQTERIEQSEIDRVFFEETHHEPRYPEIERTEQAQLGYTALAGWDSEGRYMVPDIEGKDV